MLNFILRWKKRCYLLMTVAYRLQKRVRSYLTGKACHGLNTIYLADIQKFTLKMAGG